MKITSQLFSSRGAYIFGQDLTFPFIYLADAFIQSNLQLLNISRLWSN